MEFNLFKTDDDVNVINKVLKGKQTFDILLKKDVDIYNPEIRIYSDVDLTGFNYAQIEHFGRYYFIEHIEPYPNGIYTFFLKCDVLESFKGDILTSQQMVNNQKISVITDIVESDVDVDELLASLNDTSFILTTIGVDF